MYAPSESPTKESETNTIETAKEIFQREEIPFWNLTQLILSHKKTTSNSEPMAISKPKKKKKRKRKA